MTTEDQARCEEIERKYGKDFVGYDLQSIEEIRFLLDLARAADAMLRDAFLDHGIDVGAVERAVAMKCREICEEKAHGSIMVSARQAADAITAMHRLPPPEER